MIPPQLFRYHRKPTGSTKISTDKNFTNDDIDPAIQHILLALNHLPFIEYTYGSCSGHIPPFWKPLQKPQEGHLELFYIEDIPYRAKIFSFHEALTNLRYENDDGYATFKMATDLSSAPTTTPLLDTIGQYTTHCTPFITAHLLTGLWEELEHIIQRYK